MNNYCFYFFSHLIVFYQKKSLQLNFFVTKYIQYSYKQENKWCNLKRYLLLLLLLFAFANQLSYAQKGDPVKKESTDPTPQEEEVIQQLKNRHLPGFFGIAFSNSIPQGDYMRNINSSGPGFGIYGGYRISAIPVSVGAEADFHFYASETKYNRYQYGYPSYVYVNDTLSTGNSSIPISLFARLEPNIANFVFPYIEGFAGLNILSASYDMKSSYWPKQDQHETNSPFYYGFGAGAQVKLTDFIVLPDVITRMLLDVKFRYMKTGSSDYYTVRLNNDGTPTFAAYNSPTDQVLFTLGLVFHFGK